MASLPLKISSSFTWFQLIISGCARTPKKTVLLSCLSLAECKNLYLSTSLTYSYLTSSIDITPDSKVEPPILGNAEPDSTGCHGCIRTAGGGFPTWSGTLKDHERCLLGLKYPSPQSLLYYSLMLIMSFGFIWGVAPLTYIIRSFNTGKCSPPKRHLFCVHFCSPPPPISPGNAPPTKLQSVVVKRCLPGTACIWAEKLIKLKSTTFGKIPFCCNPAASKFTRIHGVFFTNCQSLVLQKFLKMACKSPMKKIKGIGMEC